MAKKQHQQSAAWIEMKYLRVVIAQTQQRAHDNEKVALIPSLTPEEGEMLFKRRLKWTILSCAICRNKQGDEYVDTYVITTAGERVNLRDIADFGTEMVNKACAEAEPSDIIQSGFIAYLGNYEMASERVVNIFRFLDGFNFPANWESDTPVNYRQVENISHHVEELD